MLMIGLLYRLINNKTKAIEAFSRYFEKYLGSNSIYTPSERSARLKEDWKKIQPYIKDLNFAG
jgi:hypothetical protein